MGGEGERGKKETKTNGKRKGTGREIGGRLVFWTFMGPYTRYIPIVIYRTDAGVECIPKCPGSAPCMDPSSVHIASWRSSLWVVDGQSAGLLLDDPLRDNLACSGTPACGSCSLSHRLRERSLWVFVSRRHRNIAVTVSYGR